MADTRIVMRYTLNITEKMYEHLKETKPTNVYKGPKRHMIGNAVFLKALDKKTIQEAYKYLKHKTMAMARDARRAVLAVEIANLATPAMEAQKKLESNQFVIDYGAGLQE